MYILYITQATLNEPLMKSPADLSFMRGSFHLKHAQLLGGYFTTSFFSSNSENPRRSV